MLRVRAIRNGVLGLALCAGTAAAQDREALVIANNAYPDALNLPDVRKTALNMSEALFGLGYDVDRLENADLAAIRAELAELDEEANDGLVIYYAGHAFAHEGETYLFPANQGLADPAALAAVSLPLTELIGAGDRIVVLDTCHGAASQTIPGQGAIDGSVATIAGERPDLLVMAAAAPGSACPAEASAGLTTVLLERLTVPGLRTDELLPEDTLAQEPVQEDPAAADTTDIAEADTETAPDEAPAEDAGGFWVASTLPEPLVLRPATSGVQLTARDYQMLETLSPSAQQRMLAMWQEAGIVVDFAGAAAPTGISSTPQGVGTVVEDTVVLVNPVRPVAAANTVSPVSVAASSVAQVSEDVSIFNAAPAPVQASAPRAVPGAGGLPLPSIIVGYPEEVVEASFEAAPEDIGPIGGQELSFDNLDARRAMKESDPELFVSLVESGAFDPPQAQLAAALQTELKRMNCYTSTIDGIWGRGSRASVNRYYEQAGGSSPSQDPDVRIFRAIVLKDDVRCPDVVVAQPRATTTTRSTTTRSTTRSTPRATQPTRTAPAPAPAPAPKPSGGRTLSNTGGTGVFR